jgi:hypothetical protein
MSDETAKLKKTLETHPFFNFGHHPRRLNITPVMTEEEETRLYEGMLAAGDRAKAVERMMENHPELVKSIRFEALKWAALYPIEFAQWRKDNGLEEPEGFRELAGDILQDVETLPSTDDLAASIFGWGQK